MPVDQLSQESAPGEELATLSIGAVSRATGIPKETLRTWERRYGFPSPRRTPSGHRKYLESTIAHLLLVNRALEQGLKPADVLPRSQEALRALIDITEPNPLFTAQQRPEVEPSTPTPLLSSSSIQHTVDSWLSMILALDEESFQRELQQHWYRLGPLGFLTHLVTPLLEAIGESWYEGAIAVIHEQFASSQLRTFLSKQWSELSGRNNGPTVVCATLPGEFHAIGLHMIAVVAAIAGCKLAFLGCDSSLPLIARTVREQSASAVLVSISVASSQAESAQLLGELRKMLPSQVTLITGGQGAPSQELEGTLLLSSLHDLKDWIASHSQQAATAAS